MKDINKIAVLGGDQRQYTAAAVIGKSTERVCIWGIYTSEISNDRLTVCDSCEAAVENASAVILPLPASPDGIYLNCPFCDKEKIKLCDIIDSMERDTIIIGGRIPKDLIARAEKKGIKVRDYFLSEDFQIKNAYITAEAALSIAMNSLDKNIRNSKIAVTGYGRIAKHLVRLLVGMGADVTVAARKESDLAWGYSSGCSVLKIDGSDVGQNNIYKLSKGYDVIYNTVPCWLFDRFFLTEVDKKTFIIDLASAPGGVDICAAKELGANVLWATSLPGKYAPASAGELIASCVKEILQSEV